MIDYKKLIKFAPDGEIAKRFYVWLGNMEIAEPGVFFSREDLVDKGIEKGLRRENILDALKELERIVNIGSFWDGKTMQYRVYPMSNEEKIERIQDFAWFEAL